MSLRDRLLHRPRPADTYPLRIDDDTEIRKELERVRMLGRLLQLQGEAADESAVRAAKADLAAAETAMAACYEPVVLRAMPPDAFEALIGEHKPRPDSEDKVWNLDTFPRAVLWECIESDLTEAEWDQVWREVLSNGERVELCNAAIRVNVRVPDSTLPKGWTQTPA
ncbi:hypothetical protein FHR32_005134 [Streptosporangium album]|uniref:Uncharacterized protein n=1 Tax=Streptosporangium album TaxID=47479 RepID=A0A7W7RZ55_9ACTN|nr:hypothetical protein [Streptosporangium album]MBB4940757.1 hypothetical protein [Streptosporangium album]